MDVVPNAVVFLDSEVAPVVLVETEVVELSVELPTACPEDEVAVVPKGDFVVPKAVIIQMLQFLVFNSND